MWAPECEWARAHGLLTGLVDMDNDRLWVPTLTAALSTAIQLEQVVYLGWMLTAPEYDQLARLLPLAVSPAEYLSSYQATGWYEAVATHTFPSYFLTEPAALDFAAERRYFVKGLVKSFGEDSVLTSQQQLAGIW